MQLLQGVERRAQDLGRVLRAGRILAVAEVQQRFTESRAPDGSSWLPLKFPRIRAGTNPKPLLDTGVMRASITGRETDSMIEVGTTSPQARVHQFGATIVPRKSKYLAIPRTREAKAAGSPRNMQGLSSRIGNRGGVMVDERGTVQFLLLKKAVIPPRPFLGFSEAWLSKFQMMLNTYLIEGKI